MKWKIAIAVGCIALLGGQANAEQHPRQLIRQMVDAVGSMAKLHALNDVEYTYIYRMPDGKEDISTERYIFDGELSWGKYSKREVHALPKVKGEHVQAFDGKSAWCTADGKRIEDPKALKTCDFLRKTNFYWFAMMQKLLDPGITYKDEGTRRVGKVDYRIVRITFGKGIGDAQDTFVLYIDPKTKLVDRFLFTVMDFGIKKPLLMTVEYKTVSGIKLPVTRRYTPSDWNGTVAKDAKWISELMSTIRFNNGFSRDMFSAKTT